MNGFNRIMKDEISRYFNHKCYEPGKHPGDIVTYLWQQPSQSVTDLRLDTMPLIDKLDQRLPHPKNTIVQEVASMIRIAVACLTESPRSRPTMEQVCRQFVLS